MDLGANVDSSYPSNTPERTTRVLQRGGIEEELRVRSRRRRKQQRRLEDGVGMVHRDVTVAREVGVTCSFGVVIWSRTTAQHARPTMSPQ